MDTKPIFLCVFYDANDYDDDGGVMSAILDGATERTTIRENMNEKGEIPNSHVRNPILVRISISNVLRAILLSVRSSVEGTGNRFLCKNTLQYIGTYTTTTHTRTRAYNVAHLYQMQNSQSIPIPCELWILLGQSVMILMYSLWRFTDT